MIIIPNKDLNNVKRHFENYDLVDFKVKKFGKRFLAKRVILTNDLLAQQMPNFLHNNAISNNLVKKSVRVDRDIFNALLNVAHNDEEFFTKIINSAVLKEISTGQIDLINAKWFRHKITVYFTQEEYRSVQNVLNELRERRIIGVTFSSLVRSILYKTFGLITEYRIGRKNPKQLLGVA